MADEGFLNGMRRDILKPGSPLLAALAASLALASCDADAGEVVSYEQIDIELPQVTDANRKTSDGFVLDPRFARARAFNRAMLARAVSEITTTGLPAIAAYEPGARGFAFAGAVNSSGAVFYRIPALDQTVEGMALIDDDEPHTIRACRISIDFEALPAGSDYSTYLKLRSLFPDPECENRARPSELRPASGGGDSAYRVFASAVVDGHHVAVIERSDDELHDFEPVDAAKAVFGEGGVSRAIPLPLLDWRAALIVLANGDSIFLAGTGPSYEFERVCAVRGLPWADILQWPSQPEEAVRRFCDEQLTQARWAYSARMRERWKGGVSPPIVIQPIKSPRPR